MAWPKGKPLKRVLSEEDLLQLALSVDDVPTTVLAGRLGKPYFTVAHARRKLREDEGWLCRLVWRSGAECGGPLASPTTPQRTVHPQCIAVRARRKARERRKAQPGQSTPYVRAWKARNPERLAEMREREKAQMRAEWPNLPPDIREAMLDKLHAADRRDYQATVAQASASGET